MRVRSIGSQIWAAPFSAATAVGQGSPGLPESLLGAPTAVDAGGQAAVRLLLLAGAIALLVAALRKTAKAVAAIMEALAAMGSVLLLVVVCFVVLALALLPAGL